MTAEAMKGLAGANLYGMSESDVFSAILALENELYAYIEKKRPGTKPTLSQLWTVGVMRGDVRRVMRGDVPKFR